MRISNNTLKDLVAKVGVLKGEGNKINFTIGLKSLGNSFACKAVIVNGGTMACVGFSLLKDGEENVSETVFSLSAADFCDYANKLGEFNSDVTFVLEDKRVIFSIPGKVTIPMVFAEEAEVELAQDFKSGLVQIVAEKTFIPALSCGGFLASPKADSRNVTDRVVMKVGNNTATFYSSDGFAVSKAWENIKVQRNATNEAIFFLRNKGASLSSKEEQEALLTKMREIGDNKEGYFNLATSMGYVPSESLDIAIPAGSVSTLVKLAGSADKLQIIVTPNNLHVMAGNVQITLALAGDTSSLYASVDKWQAVDWTAKVVVDRDDFLRSLSVMRLGAKDKPLQLSFEDNSVVIKKDDVILRTTILSCEGNTSNITYFYSVEKVISCVSKLGAGNIILRVCAPDATKGTVPLSMSSGDLTENVTGYSYILPVNAQK